MKAYVSDLIPKLYRFSKKLDNLSLLTEKHWIILDEFPQTRTVYIFRENKDLIISRNGIVKKGSWELISNSSILINTEEENYLFKQGFIDENFLILKLNGMDRYIFFINEETNQISNISIEFITNMLEQRYSQNNSIQNPLPKYEIINKTRHSNIFGKKTTIATVSFENNTQGKIYIKESTDQYYIKEKKQYNIGSKQHYYESLESCILALNILLRSGEISKSGYIITYS